MSDYVRVAAKIMDGIQSDFDAAMDLILEWGVPLRFVVSLTGPRRNTHVV